MNFALIGLRLLGVGKAIMAWLSRRSLAELACIALIGFALVQHFQLVSARHSAAHYETLYRNTYNARVADRRAYEKAQADAAAANKAHVQQIETQQQKVTTDVETDYQRKLDVLRRELRATSSGTSGKPGVPQVPNASSGPCETSGVSLPDSERLRAAENELQLDELISWVEQQSKVNPN